MLTDVRATAKPETTPPADAMADPPSTPTTTPIADPTRPTATDSMIMRRRTCLPVAPMTRSSASSRSRCLKMTWKVVPITIIATVAAMTGKSSSISVRAALEVLIAFKDSSVASWPVVTTAPSMPASSSAARTAVARFSCTSEGRSALSPAARISSGCRPGEAAASPSLVKKTSATETITDCCFVWTIPVTVRSRGLPSLFFAVRTEPTSSSYRCATPSLTRISVVVVGLVPDSRVWVWRCSPPIVAADSQGLSGRSNSIPEYEET